MGGSAAVECELQAYCMMRIPRSEVMLRDARYNADSVSVSEALFDYHVSVSCSWSMNYFMRLACGVAMCTPEFESLPCLH